jgi:hypothetical protein
MYDFAVVQQAFRVERDIPWTRTSDRDFRIYDDELHCWAVFTEQGVGTDFAEFKVKTLGLHVDGTELGDDDLTLSGRFTLGDKSNGIDLLNEDVDVTVGPTVFTIPAGSFERIWRNHYVARLDCSPSQSGTHVPRECRTGWVVFSDLGNDAWALRFFKRDVNLNPIANPVDVRLTIGDDRGRARARVGGTLTKSRGRGGHHSGEGRYHH